MTSSEASMPEAATRLPTHFETNALREIANIGAGHAATAISQMTSRRIMISVPQVTVLDLRTFLELFPAGDDHEVVAVMMSLLGDLTGKGGLILSDDNARLLVATLLRREIPVLSLDDALQQSTLRETGNIVVGAYMSALATFLGLVLLPSVPVLTHGRPSSVARDRLALRENGDLVLGATTEFAFETGASSEIVRGLVLYLPDSASRGRLLEEIARLSTARRPLRALRTDR